MNQGPLATEARSSLSGPRCLRLASAPSRPALAGLRRHYVCTRAASTQRQNAGEVDETTAYLLPDTPSTTSRLAARLCILGPMAALALAGLLPPPVRAAAVASQGAASVAAVIDPKSGLPSKWMRKRGQFSHAEYEAIFAHYTNPQQHLATVAASTSAAAAATSTSSGRNTSPVSRGSNQAAATISARVAAAPAAAGKAAAMVTTVDTTTKHAAGGTSSSSLASHPTTTRAGYAAPPARTLSNTSDHLSRAARSARDSSTGSMIASQVRSLHGAVKDVSLRQAAGETTSPSAPASAVTSPPVYTIAAGAPRVGKLSKKTSSKPSASQAAKAELDASQIIPPRRESAASATEAVTAAATAAAQTASSSFRAVAHSASAACDNAAAAIASQARSVKEGAVALKDRVQSSFVVREAPPPDAAAASSTSTRDLRAKQSQRQTATARLASVQQRLQRTVPLKQRPDAAADSKRPQNESTKTQPAILATSAAAFAALQQRVSTAASQAPHPQVEIVTGGLILAAILLGILARQRRRSVNASSSSSSSTFEDSDDDGLPRTRLEQTPDVVLAAAAGAAAAKSQQELREEANKRIDAMKRKMEENAKQQKRLQEAAAAATAAALVAPPSAYSSSQKERHQASVSPLTMHDGATEEQQLAEEVTVMATDAAEVPAKGRFSSRKWWPSALETQSDGDDVSSSVGMTASTPPTASGTVSFESQSTAAEVVQETSAHRPWDDFFGALDAKSPATPLLAVVSLAAVAIDGFSQLLEPSSSGRRSRTAPRGLGAVLACGRVPGEGKQLQVATARAGASQASRQSTTAALHLSPVDVLLAPAAPLAHALRKPDATTTQQNGSPRVDMNKYDAVLDVIQAALNDAAPGVSGESKYDPLRALLAAAPPTPGRERYDFARELIFSIARGQDTVTAGRYDMIHDVLRAVAKPRGGAPSSAERFCPVQDVLQRALLVENWGPPRHVAYDPLDGMVGSLSSTTWTLADWAGDGRYCPVSALLHSEAPPPTASAFDPASSLLKGDWKWDAPTVRSKYDVTVAASEAIRHADAPGWVAKAGMHGPSTDSWDPMAAAMAALVNWEPPAAGDAPGRFDPVRSALMNGWSGEWGEREKEESPKPLGSGALLRGIFRNADGLNDSKGGVKNAMDQAVNKTEKEKEEEEGAAPLTFSGFGW